MSLSDLVASTGRNKRAKAVQYFRDGLSFLSKDDCEKALPYFEKAVESDSNYAEAWAQAGFCNEKLGQTCGGLEASKKAVSLRPSAESYFNIGLASFYLKQYRECGGSVSTVDQTRSVQLSRRLLRARIGLSRLGQGRRRDSGLQASDSIAA